MQTRHIEVLNIGLGSNTLTTLETDAKMLENKAKSGNFNVAVGGGIEMRRGSGRLQGVYGLVLQELVKQLPNYLMELILLQQLQKQDQVLLLV